jgi:hypothetical protein
MAKRVFQAAFGLWLLVMFVTTVVGWKPSESMLTEQGVRWTEVNLRPDMIAALLLIYGIGAATFSGENSVAYQSKFSPPP